MSEGQGRVVLKGHTGNYSGNTYEIEGGEFTIGRNPDNDLVMDEKTISAHHAKIVKTDRGYEIHDLNSTNGVYVNGEKVSHKALRSDDKIKFDIYEFRYADPNMVSATVVSSAPDFGSDDNKTVVSGKTIDPSESTGKSQRPVPQPSASAPRTSTARFEPGGNMFAGVIVGLIIALIIGLGGFVVSAVVNGVPLDNIVDVLKVSVSGYATANTHEAWTNVTWNTSSIIILVSVLLAPLLGGLFAGVIGKSNPFATAFVFSLLLVVIYFIAMLAVNGFNFDMFQFYRFLGMNGWPAVGVLYGYFFGVTFVLSFIGALMGKR